MPLVNLFAPPSKFALPLSKGADLLVEFHYEDPDNAGTFLDWPVGVEVWLYIDSATPVVSQATIIDHRAVVKVESTVVDLVERRVPWRLVVKDGTLDSVACNGLVTRSDG